MHKLRGMHMNATNHNSIADTYTFNSTHFIQEQMDYGRQRDRQASRQADIRSRNVLISF